MFNPMEGSLQFKIWYPSVMLRSLLFQSLVLLLQVLAQPSKAHGKVPLPLFQTMVMLTHIFLCTATPHSSWWQRMALNGSRNWLLCSFFPRLTGDQR